MLFNILLLCCNSFCSLASWQDKILGQTDFEPVMINELGKKYLQEVFVAANFSNKDLDCLCQDYKAKGLAENQIVLIVRDSQDIQPIAQSEKGYEKTCREQILRDAVVLGLGIPLEGFETQQPSKAVLAFKWSLINRNKK